MRADRGKKPTAEAGRRALASILPAPAEDGAAKTDGASSAWWVGSCDREVLDVGLGSVVLIAMRPPVPVGGEGGGRREEGAVSLEG